MTECAWWTCTEQTESKFCCHKCSNKYHVDRRRREMKLRLVLDRGGSCELCGYNKCVDALEFHHINPENKNYALSKNGNTRSLTENKKEADKCDLLCANCHREREAEKYEERWIAVKRKIEAS